MKPLLWILGIAAVIAVVVVLVETWPRAADALDETSRQVTEELHGAEESTGDAPAETGPTVERRDVDARGPVAGRVVGPDGTPVSGARVVLLRQRSPWPARDLQEVEAVLTDPDGRFRFRAARDESLVVEVSHDDLARRRVAVSPQVESLAIRVEHGFEVTGVVYDAMLASPVEGALVTVEPGPWSTRASRTTTTAADGTFRLSGLSVGPLGVARVTARHRPYAPATLSMQAITAGEPVRLEVSQLGQPLTGRVVHSVDPSRPIVGARVQVFPSTAWNRGLFVPYEATTDPSGAFHILGLGLGNHTVVVQHDDFTASSRVVTIGRSSVFQSFELVQRSAVSGRLVGPVPENTELRIETNGGELGRAKVARDGSFAFDVPLSVGSARIDVLSGTCAFAQTTGREITVTIEDAPRTELELEVQAPSSLRGRVVDQRGAPVQGVQVWTPRYRLQPRHAERFVVATAADGSFELRGLPVGSADVTFEHDEFAVVRTVLEVREPGEVRQLDDVLLPDPGVIRGRVTRGGAPLAGATVFAGRDRSDDDSTVTGPDGRFALRRLPPGRYRILARWSTLPLQVAGTMSVLDAGTVVDGVDIDFPPGRKIEGMIVDSVGLPVAEARIVVVGRPGAMATTDARGAFEMEVPQGDVELQVLSPTFRAQHRELVPSESDRVRVRLPWVPHGSLEARVLGLPGMRPVPRAFVRLVPLDLEENAEESVRSQRTITSVRADLPGGRLRLDLVPAGRSSIEIQAPGWAPWVSEITLQRGQELDLGTVRLEPGLEIKGTVVDPEGRPVPGAWVHLGEPEDLRYEEARHTHTGRDGRFVLSGVSPDATGLVVAADGWAPTRREIRIPDDLLRESPIDIVVERGSSIVVQLAREQGPVDDFRLIALRRDGEIVAIESTDLSGRVEFAGLPAAGYSVALFGDREEEIAVEVDGTSRDYPVSIRL